MLDDWVTNTIEMVNGLLNALGLCFTVTTHSKCNSLLYGAKTNNCDKWRLIINFD